MSMTTSQRTFTAASNKFAYAQAFSRTASGHEDRPSARPARRGFTLLRRARRTV